ncbi:hypothetical protein AKJ45_01775 [candidate division MSBL1 archaeon SCGC-AAA261F19]|uniref:DUF7343 domain-containing protein n=2 Tax=candidate division MSBL1 TaxID=215777 RepID=A0A133VAA4_9EURY|nr:hypothetical protein AKJ43_02920 [candidate division MSBL1 archaeon SCGC-AAA261D19]KXB03366.1 hypothetical protein AKJ45_01775 [candidate division MSBL1 archaeon SCGC-AAA261F19]
MKASEILTVVLTAAIISILSGIILFGALGIAPGVGVQMIMRAFLVLIVITTSITLAFYIGFRKYVAERARGMAMMTLSEDEQRVVRKMIEMNEEVEQKELWRQFDFSRSKLSALLNNLEEKNVITKRRFRRTNLLRLTDEFQGK